MAILQALFSFLTRSAGTALNAIFGWAVIALFGQTSPREKTLLSALVGAAAAWPLLVVGTVFPKAALFVIAFVPLAKSVPSMGLRLLWIALTLVVPIAVGMVIASRTPHEQLPESGLKKLLRGFPITVALAAAFLLTLILAPLLKLVAVARRLTVVHVPVIIGKGALLEIAIALTGTLGEHGIELHERELPWHMSAPNKILVKLGGKAFAGGVARRIEYRAGPRLDLAVAGNEVILRGFAIEVGKAQALATEVLAPRDALQTFDAKAQDLERQIKRVWSVFLESPERHENSPPLRRRLDEISRELAEANLPFDEWQVVYREALQLDRALDGQKPLLAHPLSLKDGAMPKVPEEKVPLPGPAVMLRELPPGSVPLSIEGMSNRELFGHVADSALQLAKKEIELARVELKADLKRELGMAKGLGIAGVCALLTANMLLVALAFGLAHFMPEWGAALSVAAVVLSVGTVAGLAGWKKRVTAPMQATRRTLKEDAQWAKERLA